MTIVVGTDQLYETNQTDYFKTQSKFNLEDLWFDIDLARVVKPIEFNDKFNKKCLRTETFNEVNVKALLTNWDVTNVRIILKLFSYEIKRKKIY